MKTILTNNWNSILSKEFEKDYYFNLKNFLTNEYETKTVYPNINNIFNALHYTDYNDVRVVILGQDPYHGENQSHGLSFSVMPGVRIPPSLKNIFKELNEDLGFTLPNNGYLKKWADQGILLLNTVLTVRSGEANSHKNRGWETFTDAVISSLNDSNSPIAFILWGNNAIAKKKLITNPKHYVIESVHPSPLSARRGFFGSKPFSKVNNFLIETGREPIDWQIDNV